MHCSACKAAAHARAATAATPLHPPTWAAGCSMRGPKGLTSGVAQPPSPSTCSHENMWSVKRVPNLRPCDNTDGGEGEARGVVVVHSRLQGGGVALPAASSCSRCLPLARPLPPTTRPPRGWRAAGARGCCVRSSGPGRGRCQRRHYCSCRSRLHAASSRGGSASRWAAAAAAAGGGGGWQRRRAGNLETHGGAVRLLMVRLGCCGITLNAGCRPQR